MWVTANSAQIQRLLLWVITTRYVSLRRTAHALLDALQAVHVHSPLSVHELAQSRGNRAYQIDGTSCGWHALHYIETEMRRFAGEGQ